MIIAGVEKDDIWKALRTINHEWRDNVEISQFHEDLITEGAWKVRLRVKDPNGPGHSINRPVSWAQRNVTACYHVHTSFFLALPETAIMTAGGKFNWIPRSEPHKWHPWNKHGIPVELLCECIHTRMDYDPRNPNRVKPINWKPE